MPAFLLFLFLNPFYAHPHNSSYPAVIYPCIVNQPYFPLISQHLCLLLWSIFLTFHSNFCNYAIQLSYFILGGIITIVFKKIAFIQHCVNDIIMHSFFYLGIILIKNSSNRTSAFSL